MKYRIYIDEVGNPDLESSDNPNHRFLSLSGVVFELSYVKNIVHPQLEALKTKYFNSHPDDPVILHRKELLNARPPFECLKDANIRHQFDKELLNLLEQWTYVVISVCLDKKRHKETYTVWRYDPYHYCLAILLERYVFFLEQSMAKGDVMAESRGGKEDTRLKRAFRRLWESGTDFIAPERFQRVLTSRELKVKQKQNNISGLQIADLIAHPSRNEILYENKFKAHPPARFGEKIIQILTHKYYQRGNKIYGKKML
ncbi:MAG: DUF3800 domain-containing protein [candidate division KSB1 bacterium]|nr:DUF3800 domain-containing protein [candidate division KSB1 bacterium]